MTDGLTESGPTTIGPWRRHSRRLAYENDWITVWHDVVSRPDGGAGIYGLVALLPQYFLEERLNRDFPPAITHPEHFYGFVGVAAAWQLAFLLISRDVARFRPLMPVTVVEKISFGAAAVVLFAQGRVPGAVRCRQGRALEEVLLVEIVHHLHHK